MRSLTHKTKRQLKITKFLEKTCINLSDNKHLKIDEYLESKHIYNKKTHKYSSIKQQTLEDKNKNDRIYYMNKMNLLQDEVGANKDMKAIFVTITNKSEYHFNDDDD